MRRATTGWLATAAAFVGAAFAAGCDCGSVPVRGLPACTDGLVLCSGACVDATECGARCAACPSPAHATAACDGTRCDFECHAGFTRCPAPDRCADLQSDPQNCGACGRVCAAPAGRTAACALGDCEERCPEGTRACNGACVPSGPPGWSFETIPGLAEGERAGALWTGGCGEVYVWTSRYKPGTDKPESWLRRRAPDASWSIVLQVPDGHPGQVWGSGPGDVFASHYRCSGGAANCGEGARARMSHYDGVSFAEQALPAAVGTHSIHQIRGERGNVYANYHHGILRYDGAAWQVAYECTANGHDCYTLEYVARNEVYAVWCWGHVAYDGAAWTHYRGFDFCDIGSAWGMRDAQGALHLYAAGQNNFSNCAKVWRFTENTATAAVGDGSWGSKYGYVLEDCNTYNCGGALGLWGSFPDDLWLLAGQWSTCEPRARLYHYGGDAWAEDTSMGPIPPAAAIWGAARDDVWVSLQDGRLLHYGAR